jgi:hypothetical protein
MDDQRKGAVDQARALSGPKKDSYAALVAVGFASEKGDETEEHEDEKVCESLSPSVIPDAAMPLSGTFSIGPTVVTDTPNNDGISMHEMGHLLERELTTLVLSQQTAGWFSATKTCFENIRPNGSKYFSEDFADLISSRAPSKNTACIFQSDGPNPTLTLGPNSPTDPHSGDFYRLLAIERAKKGDIPRECKEVLRENHESLPLKACGTSN